MWPDWQVSGRGPGSSVPCRRIASLVITVGALGPVVLSWASDPVRAHEEYVTDGGDVPSLVEFYQDALMDPWVVGPLVFGGVAIFLAALWYLYVRPFRRDVLAFRVSMSEYRTFVPWLLRISFGIPLIGAGFGGYFISPAVGTNVRLVQVLLGFLLLFGLFTRLVAITVLVLYVVGVFVDPRLLLQVEFVGGAVAILAVGSGRPSADHVLARLGGTTGTIVDRLEPFDAPLSWGQSRLAPLAHYLPTICRVGLGVSFIYLGVSQKLLDPGLALSVVERYGLSTVVPVPPALWVLGAGLTETVLGLALLAGLFTRGVAFAALVVFTTTLFALPDDPVLAHVSLYGLASVLLITGGGPWSLDATLSQGEPTVEVPPVAEPQQTDSGW